MSNQTSCSSSRSDEIDLKPRMRYAKRGKSSIVPMRAAVAKIYCGPVSQSLSSRRADSSSSALRSRRPWLTLRAALVALGMTLKKVSRAGPVNQGCEPEGCAES